MVKRDLVFTDGNNDIVADANLVSRVQSSVANDYFQVELTADGSNIGEKVTEAFGNNPISVLIKHDDKVIVQYDNLVLNVDDFEYRDDILIEKIRFKPNK